MLTAALIGLPGSGKTTFFRLLTQKASGTKAEMDRAVVAVADPRLQVLAEAYRPKKVTPAQTAFWDVPGLREGAAGGEARRFLTEIRKADALIQVLDAFSGAPGADPEEAAGTMALELASADLDVVDRRLERLRKQKPKPEEAVEKETLERLRPLLAEGTPVRDAGLSSDAQASLRSLALLTEKPVLYVMNVGEDGEAAGHDGAAERLEGPVVVASAAIEAEIAELPAEERGAFLASLGFDEPGIDRLTRACYRHLGLISFLTAGEDEVRAWTIRDGETAREAAGKVHSDISRGFIRAEVVSYEAFAAHGLSMTAVKEAGDWRLEGKDYIVKDGDIISFRFNA